MFDVLRKFDIRVTAEQAEEAYLLLQKAMFGAGSESLNPNAETTSDSHSLLTTQPLRSPDPTLPDNPPANPMPSMPPPPVVSAHNTGNGSMYTTGALRAMRFKPINEEDALALDQIFGGPDSKDVVQTKFNEKITREHLRRLRPQKEINGEVSSIILISELSTPNCNSIMYFLTYVYSQDYGL